mmetsp:Transcript_36523/g.71829  ORF Transcript_36523/g.71829 Transcript_36523/m.71829 type:complete len:126 (+) Transcript_36523:678-1055(+)
MESMKRKWTCQDLRIFIVSSRVHLIMWGRSLNFRKQLRLRRRDGSPRWYRGKLVGSISKTKVRSRAQLRKFRFEGGGESPQRQHCSGFIVFCRADPGKSVRRFSRLHSIAVAVVLSNGSSIGILV